MTDNSDIIEDLTLLTEDELKPTIPIIREPKWDLRKQKILRLDLQGHNQTDIARRMGLKSSSPICRLQQNPDYKTRLADAKRSAIEKVQSVFEKEAVLAAEKICRLAKNGKGEDRIQLDACRDILDRSGCKPIQVIETRQRAYSPQEVESAKKTLSELEESIIRLERKDSIFVLKRTKINETPQVDAIDTTNTKIGNG